MPTGARWTVDYKVFDRANDLVFSRYRGEHAREYDAVIALTLRQPLLRNAGYGATETKVRIADLDRDIAFQRYRLRMMEMVGAAIGAYWDLYFAQQIRDIKESSLRVRDRILRDIEDKVAFGKTARTEATEARAGIALRKAERLAARQAVVEESNRIRGLLGLRKTDGMGVLVVNSSVFTAGRKALDFNGSVNRALQYWPEVLITRKTVEQVAVQRDFASNQALPQLDLKGSYGRAGLDIASGQAMEQALSRDYPSWSLGLEFRMPIANRQASSNAKAAVLRYEQAMMEKEAVELALHNALDTKIQKTQQIRDEMHEHRLNVELRQAALEAALACLDAGKCMVHDVLDKEERLNEARVTELKSRIEGEKAMAAVELAEGTLLDRYGVTLELVDAL